MSANIVTVSESKTLVQVNETTNEVTVIQSAPNQVEVVLTTAVSGGASAWGAITGTLSNQTDLSTALDNKVPYTGATSDVNLAANKITTVAVQANSSAGGELRTNSGAVAAHFGSGGSANGTLYGGWNYNGGTADTILSLGASKTITSLSTATYPSLTELSYVKGTTSNIQSQINNLQDDSMHFLFMGAGG